INRESFGFPNTGGITESCARYNRRRTHKQFSATTDWPAVLTVNSRTGLPVAVSRNLVPVPKQRQQSADLASRLELEKASWTSLCWRVLPIASISVSVSVSNGKIFVV